MLVTQSRGILRLQPVSFPLMETSAENRVPVRDLPIVAGHLALDFANTVDDPLGPTRFDHIADHPALLHWATRVTILTAPAAGRLARVATEHPRKAQYALRRAHQLRHLLNAVFGEVATGSAQIGVREWADLRSSLTAAVTRAELTRSGDHFHLSWPSHEYDLASLLDPITFAAVDLLTTPDVVRVKQCAGCPWLFLDHSKNGSRRWCAMNDCGTHEKIRRYVARRATRRGKPVT